MEKKKKKKNIRFLFLIIFFFGFVTVFNIFEQGCFRNDQWKLCPSNGEDINLHSCIKYII